MAGKEAGADQLQPTELLSPEEYLYDHAVIARLQEKIGNSPVVILNGMGTLYAPREGDPDGPRIPFDNIDTTLKVISQQMPHAFIIGWTGKGPRGNVEKAVGKGVDLVIGESNLKPPSDMSAETAREGYANLVQEADWLSTQQKGDLIAHGPSQSIKDRQLFARGRIVIIDSRKNNEGNVPGRNNPFITLINSDVWAKSKKLPRYLASKVAWTIKVSQQLRRR